MKVSELTRARLANQREERDMKKAGYEYLGEGGGLIWQIHRGSRLGQIILDAKISNNRRFVWIKIGNPTAA